MGLPLSKGQTQDLSIKPVFIRVYKRYRKLTAKKRLLSLSKRWVHPATIIRAKIVTSKLIKPSSTADLTSSSRTQSILSRQVSHILSQRMSNHLFFPRLSAAVIPNTST